MADRRSSQLRATVGPSPQPRQHRAYHQPVGPDLPPHRLPGRPDRHTLRDPALPAAGTEPFKPRQSTGRTRTRHQNPPRPRLLPRPNLPASHPPHPEPRREPQQPRPRHLPRQARPTTPPLPSRPREPTGRPRPHGQRRRNLADHVHPSKKKFFNIDSNQFLSNWVVRPKANNIDIIPLKNAITPATASGWRARIGRHEQGY